MHREYWYPWLLSSLLTRHGFHPRAAPLRPFLNLDQRRVVAIAVEEDADGLGLKLLAIHGESQNSVGYTMAKKMAM